MTMTQWASLALALYGVGLVTTFGVRTWSHWRATGTSGFRGLSGAVGSRPWWGGVLFAGALALTALGLALAATGVTPVIEASAALPWAGLTLTIAAFGGVVLAQSGMGTSWRIGVDASERTALVTGGAFALARNPVFTAMCATLVGLTLMVPAPLTLAGLVCLVVAVELQVRAVEEPYLLATHGDEYRAYAARVGRFIPRVGRLRSPQEQRALR